jgi:C2H2-type zinc finger/Zinc finger, C2H2 type
LIYFLGFRVKHDLKDHIQTHINRESRRKHPCAFCPAILLSKSALKNHEHIFHSEIIEEHPCECGKVFGSRMKLYQHRSTVHTKGHFPCPTCNKVYTGKNALQKHIIKHHGNKVPCEICLKLFAPGMFMNRHLKSHGPPQFICDYEGCNKEFHSRSALGYHNESQHKPQVTVNCETCNAPYTSQRNLNRHIQRQHNNVRVQCEVEGCNHTAARKGWFSG